MTDATDRAAETKAWEELARLTAGAGSAANWCWSIPARPERDSDLILAAGLQEVADERDRLAAALAQSERDLADARKSEQWMAEQKDLMRDQRDRVEQKLSEQAAVIEAVREWNRLTNGRPRYRELDQIINPEEWANEDTTEASQ